MPRIVENSDILYLILVCIKNDYREEKSKLFPGMIFKVLLLPMEGLGLVVNGMNPIVSLQGRK
jgi:hypothetical protein